MAGAVKKESSRRTYVSPKRDEQARATRWAILMAARSLFIERGYGATTIQAIADEADVAVQTIYAAFGNKREILKQVIDVSIVGDDEPVDMAHRESTAAVRRQSDPRTRAKMAAAVIRGVAEGAAPVFKVVRDAAAVDADAAELWKAMVADRRRGMSSAARMLAGGGRLQVDLEDAADTLFVLYSPDVALMLTENLGWSFDRYEAWMAETLERLLLPPVGRAPRR